MDTDRLLVASGKSPVPAPTGEEKVTADMKNVWRKLLQKRPWAPTGQSGRSSTQLEHEARRLQRGTEGIGGCGHRRHSHLTIDRRKEIREYFLMASTGDPETPRAAAAAWPRRPKDACTSSTPSEKRARGLLKSVSLTEAAEADCHTDEPLYQYSTVALVSAQRCTSALGFEIESKYR